MDNKYYTPSISEFHVGFEYEVLIRNIWVKQKMTVFKNFNPDFIKFYRVKFLDKGDIESLGFVFTGNYHEDFTFVKKQSKYELSFTPSNNWLCIYYFEYINQDKDVFCGKIKNKSELKKLLNQLNIH